MDHRISKDMISSGMSYTGEKSQADLNRTQYGSVARPDSLMEAYASIYEKKDSETTSGDRIPNFENNKKSKPVKGMEVSAPVEEQTGPALPGEPGRPGTPKAPGGRPHLPGEKQTPLPKKPGASLQLAHADLFDIIKGHLMDEGLTEAAAIEMMVSMTEEERDAVIDEMNAGPSTPVKVYDTPKGKQVMPHMGAGRPTNVRLKGV